MPEQTIHSSSSLARARPLAHMLRALTTRVSATTAAAAFTLGCSLLTIHSPLVSRHEQRLLRAELVRHVPVNVDDDSGRAHRQ